MRPSIRAALAAVSLAACLPGSQEEVVAEDPNAGGGEGGDGGGDFRPIPSGAEPSCTAYPGPVAMAGLDEGLGTSMKTQLSATFFQQGSLETLDSASCTQVEGTQRADVSAMVAWISCLEAYDCGGCEVWVGYYPGDGAENAEGWYLLGARNGDAGCDEFMGFYTLLPPEEVSGQPGDGGPVDPRRPLRRLPRHLPRPQLLLHRLRLHLPGLLRPDQLHAGQLDVLRQLRGLLLHEQLPVLSRAPGSSSAASPRRPPCRARHRRGRLRGKLAPGRPPCASRCRAFSCSP